MRNSHISKTAPIVTQWNELTLLSLLPNRRPTSSAPKFNEQELCLHLTHNYLLRRQQHRSPVARVIITRSVLHDITFYLMRNEISRSCKFPALTRLYCEMIYPARSARCSPATEMEKFVMLDPVWRPGWKQSLEMIWLKKRTLLSIICPQRTMTEVAQRKLRRGFCLSGVVPWRLVPLEASTCCGLAGPGGDIISHSLVFTQD